MTRVLVSARVLDKQVGGNTRYARTIYSGLARHGVEHALGRPPLATGRARSAVYAGWEGVVWPLAPGRGVDVLHFPADTGAVVPGRVPIVSTVHGLATLHMEGVRSPRADRLWRARVSRLVEVSDEIITISNSSARDIDTIVPGAMSKITVIPHGIDHRTFTPIAGASDEAERARLDLDGPYFLYLGNIDPRKNVIELCRAAEQVFDRTGIPLLVSGAPAWESESIMQVVESTRGVRYLGRVSDEALVPLLRGALAFVFPSKYEGFGFPVAEAMACGTPVICSDRGSLGEVAGDAALLVQGLDADSIALEMLRLAEDEQLRAELRERGLVNVQRFVWETSIAEHARVLTRAAAAR
ncbi:glycosyltransferase family 1 protein [Rathayibacter sp. VKM Ac-2927]|uniref:glycosyltransferase family 4 protein n=1 Tax=Rathayibacter sp. VKM Ac-2927 TaxID=2929478 RepID=UPI001FB45ED9|nr:glycosyltransferase family 1 protein [Rathayibacter sp. VKM Ac-2927]MCJ1685664.1 glycosyltransferase family 4 protein [Rathayibacter sp. VKM Ac-2927]